MEEKAQIIESFYRHQGRMPSYAEICELFGYNSKNSASRLVQKLSRFGVLYKDDRVKLIPNFAQGSIRLLGLVEAGFPAPVEEQALDTITLDQWLVKKEEATYILKVKGESMIDAGIIDGDYVLVERTGNIKPGDIVVAEMDGEWTLKYLRENAKGFYLEAANPLFGNLFPEEKLEVEAKVISVIRKFDA